MKICLKLNVSYFSRRVYRKFHEYHKLKGNVVGTIITILISSLTLQRFVAYINHRLGKSEIKLNYRIRRISGWNSMVNQAHESYPLGRFESWTNFPLSSHFFLQTKFQVFNQLL